MRGLKASRLLKGEDDAAGLYKADGGRDEQRGPSGPAQMCMRRWGKVAPHQVRSERHAGASACSAATAATSDASSSSDHHICPLACELTNTGARWRQA